MEKQPPSIITSVNATPLHLQNTPQYQQPKAAKTKKKLLVVLLILLLISVGYFLFDSKDALFFNSNKPFIIKSIDKANKTGEFVINNIPPEKRKLINPPAEKQAMLEITYNNKKIAINKAYEYLSSFPVDYSLDFSFLDSSKLYLILQVEYDNKNYITVLENIKNYTQPLLIKKTIPYDKSFKVKVYDDLGKLLLEKQMEI